MKNPWPFGNYDAFLAGGAVLSTSMKQDIADFDIYPKNRQAVEDLIFGLLEDNAFCVGISDRAVSIKHNDHTNNKGERLVTQIITYKDFPTAESIFEDFDFTCCMAAFDLSDDSFYTGKTFWEDVASRTLKFHPGTRFPLASLLRVHKYREKGFFMPKGETIKLAMSIARAGVPRSWDELADAIGGHYGRGVKMICRDKSFDFDTAMEALSHANITQIDDADFSNIPTEAVAAWVAGKLRMIDIPGSFRNLFVDTDGNILASNIDHRAPLYEGEFVNAYKQFKAHPDDPKKLLPGMRTYGAGSDFEYTIGQINSWDKAPYLYSSATYDRHKRKVLIPVKSIRSVGVEDNVVIQSAEIFIPEEEK